MLRVFEIKDSVVWNNFLYSSDSNYFLQSWQWGEFEYLGLGKRIHRLGVKDQKGNLISICLCIEEVSRFGKYIYCPRGPILNWSKINKTKDVLKSLIGYFSKKGFICLRFDPAVKNDNVKVLDIFQDLGFKDFVDFIQVERAWVLDIKNKTDEELMAGMRKKARYSLKQAMKSDIEIIQSKDTQKFEEFLDILESISIKKNFPLVNKKYLLKQFEFLGDYMKFFYAINKGQMVAGGLFIFYGNESSYLRGASIDNVNSAHSSYLLQWEVIKAAKEAGIERHNFWGVVKDKDYHPRHPAFGYSNFKKGFGGHLEEYIRAKDFPYNMIKYKLLSLNQLYRKFKYRKCA